MDFHFEDHRPVPRPSDARRGERLVGLPVSAGAKVLLRGEMVRQGVRPAELARRLGTAVCVGAARVHRRASPPSPPRRPDPAIALRRRKPFARRGAAA